MCSACRRRCASAIARHGIRNGLLTSIAPTGTISLLAGNVSSGIEPVFDFRYERRVLERDGSSRTETVEDYAHALYRQMFGAKAPLTDAFVTAEELSPRAHLEMQAAAAEPCRQLDLQDHQLPGRHLLRGLQGCLPRGLRPGPQGLHDLPAECRDGRRAQPLGRSQARRGRPRKPAADVAVPAPEAAAEAPLLPGLVLPERAGEVVYMAKPLEREGVLAGYTYKIRWPSSDHAMYITINDIERDGPAGGGHSTRRRPFEIFINSKNLEHYAWTVALTRMISAIFRRGGDVAFVVEELKAVFDPQGGQWMGGRYVPSLLAAIGGVIETHMIRTGFLSPPRQPGEEEERARPRPWPPASVPPGPAALSGRGRICPRCSAQSLRAQEGCLVCDNCGYSKCN